MTFSVFVDFRKALNWKNLSDPASTAHIELLKKEPVEEMGTGRAYRYISVFLVLKPLSLFLLQQIQTIMPTACLIHQTQIVASARVFVSCRAAKKIIAQQIGVSSANDFDAASVWQGVYTF